MATVFRAVVPRGFGLDPRVLEREALGAMDHGLAIVRDDFNKTTATWRRKPTFVKERARVVRGGLEGAVWTQNQIYRYVDEGTRPHIIRPKQASALAFRTGFKAKTRPRIISSRAGGASGPRAFAKAVQHPGTRAREFAATIRSRRERNLLALLRVAFTRALIRPKAL